tara:strand:- start:375 stop:698 length:324 start_codon:yes stop_codon:yes gene_type:complete
MATNLPRFLKNDVVAVRARADLWRPVTPAEEQEWRDSPRSKGMNSAGETKLGPRSKYRKDGGQTYRVLRGRVSTDKGWRKVGGCALIECVQDSTQWYAHRKDLHKVG